MALVGLINFSREFWLYMYNDFQLITFIAWIANPAKSLRGLVLEIDVSTCTVGKVHVCKRLEWNLFYSI